MVTIEPQPIAGSEDCRLLLYVETPAMGEGKTSWRIMEEAKDHFQYSVSKVASDSKPFTKVVVDFKNNRATLSRILDFEERVRDFVAREVLYPDLMKKGMEQDSAMRYARVQALERTHFLVMAVHESIRAENANPLVDNESVMLVEVQLEEEASVDEIEGVLGTPINELGAYAEISVNDIFQRIESSGGDNISLISRTSSISLNDLRVVNSALLSPTNGWHLKVDSINMTCRWPSDVTPPNYR